MSTKSVITDLVQTLEDGRKGFADAAKKLADDGNQQLATTFERFATQRQELSTELRRVAAQQGISLDESGSIAGSLHRGWIGLKDALTGDSAESIVSAAKSGEDHAVSEYDKALDDDDLPADVRTTVSDQRTTIRSTRDSLESMTS